MKQDAFYLRVVETMALPPDERHTQLAQLHTLILDDYLRAIRAIDAEKANRLARVGEETRTIAQVVGHIAEWERFAILAAADILAGIVRPRMMTGLDGYVEPDGTSPKFASDDEFNAYQAEKHSKWTWAQIQTLALDTAKTLHALFTQANLLTSDRLEKTRTFRKRFTNGVTINKIGIGWSLWLTMLEHSAIEHATELEIPA